MNEAVRDWFLTPHERDNPITQIDRRRDRPEQAHTTGNEVHRPEPVTGWRTRFDTRSVR